MKIKTQKSIYKTLKERPIKSIIVLLGLLFVSIVLHNLVYALSGIEEAFFFVMSLVLLIVLIVYSLYSLARFIFR